MATNEVVVVGAGPAGLATAAVLRTAGIASLIIDQADSLGSSWFTRYDNFRLHTTRWLSGLPGMGIPARSGRWVGRDEFISYLQSYSERQHLSPRLGCQLTGLTNVDGRWRLSTSDGDLEARHVVLATGACATPQLPPWPGRDSFAPPLIHSSDYRNPAAYAGSRVLVVGSGNSATEIAADLTSTGNVEVQLAVRTPPVILRRSAYGIPAQWLGIATRRLPAGAIDAFAATTRRITVPSLAGHGLAAPRAPYSQFRHTGTLPVLDHGFVRALRSGAIAVLPGVTGLSNDAVIHSDGSQSHPDVVIAATGYIAGFAHILTPLGLLDAGGNPSFGPAGASGRAAGLYAVGANVVLSGMLREIGHEAMRLAAAIART
jgi:putative flavoprotein involved in K+ transport